MDSCNVEQKKKSQGLEEEKEEERKERKRERKK
jgi:hypothetical protein